MRVLIDDRPGVAQPTAPGAELTLEGCEAAYRTQGPWVRANMIASINGVVAGSDGLSGSLNTPEDHEVFALLRRWAQVIVVGAGTARAEGYGPTRCPLVVVSGRGELPPALHDVEAGQVVLATHAQSPGLEAARALLGADGVIVAGADQVEAGRLVASLQARGFERILVEGGPRLLGDFVASGVVDELCLSTAPTLLSGSRMLIAFGSEAAEIAARLVWLGQWKSTLFARWHLHR